MEKEYDPLDLTTQQEIRDADTLEDKLVVRQEVDDFLWLMRNKQGRRFMWRMLKWTHYFKTSMTGNSFTFFHEGERNIGIRLIDSINAHCPELYGAMIKENKNGRPNDSDGGNS